MFYINFNQHYFIIIFATVLIERMFRIAYDNISIRKMADCVTMILLSHLFVSV